MGRAISIAAMTGAVFLCLAAKTYAQPGEKIVMLCTSSFEGTTTYVLDLASRTVDASNPGGRNSKGVTIGSSKVRFGIDSVTDDAVVWHSAVATMTLNRYTGLLSIRWNSGAAGESEPCQRQQKQF